VTRSKPALLVGEARDRALAELPLWHEVEGRDAIARSLRFGSFDAAFGFMARVAIVAERLDHHPEWTNVWDRVDVVLATHEAGGLTARDVELARRIDAIAGSTPPTP
jgi:4a-hydroxytetrahydrobiopterin dehydratase